MGCPDRGLRPPVTNRGGPRRSDPGRRHSIWTLAKAIKQSLPVHVQTSVATVCRAGGDPEHRIGACYARSSQRQARTHLDSRRGCEHAERCAVGVSQNRCSACPWDVQRWHENFTSVLLGLSSSASGLPVVVSDHRRPDCGGGHPDDVGRAGQFLTEPKVPSVRGGTSPNATRRPDTQDHSVSPHSPAPGAAITGDVRWSGRSGTPVRRTRPGRREIMRRASRAVRARPAPGLSARYGAPPPKGCVARLRTVQCSGAENLLEAPGELSG